jgi:AcrR family transcriptional regulator
MTTAATPRRMAPDARRDQILAAARAIVAERGMAHFSLEEVGREAGVAASLPRHYFGSRDGLLLAVARQVIEEVVAVLGAPRGGPRLTERLVTYLDILARDPWVHGVWIQAADHSEDLSEMVAGARRRLAELSFDVRWEDLSQPERLRLLGWAGYFEAVISGWIDQGLGDRRPVIETLADAAVRLGVKGV